MVMQQRIAVPVGQLSADDEPLTVIRSDPGGSVRIANGNFLLSAQFERIGDDLLLVGRDGGRVLVVDYFASAHPPTLVSEFGAEIAGDLADILAGPPSAGAYAQTGAPAGRPAIGAVEALTGDATVQRTDGSRGPLAIGTPVFQGDVVETTPGSRLAIVFNDKTSFSLDSATRMVLDELVYNPGGESRSAFSLVQGTFVYISGEIAKVAPQNVQIRTPVATVGIRGTEVGFVILGPGDAGGASIAVIDGEISVRNSGGSQNLSAGFVVSVSSNLAAPSIPIATPLGNITAQYGALRGYGANAINNSIIRLQRDLQQPQLLPPPAPGRGEGPVTGGMRAASGQGGSNTNEAGQAKQGDAASTALASISPAAGVQGEAAAAGAGISIFGPSALIVTSAGLVAVGPIAGLGGFTLTGPLIGTGSSRLLASGDHRVTTAPAATGPSALVAVADQSLSAPGGGTMQIDVLANDTAPPNDPVTIVAVDTSNTLGTVSIDPNGTTISYSAGNAFQSLGEGQTATDTFTYTIADANGVQSTATVTVTITGVNDAPVAVDDAVSATAGDTVTVLALANDTDPDSSDTRVIVGVNTAGTLGSVSILAGGAALTYAAGAAFQSLAEGETATDTFTYTMADSGGVQSTATVTVTITGINDAPTITSNGGGAVASFAIVEGTSAVATILAADPDNGSILTYAIVGGADASSFMIDSATGELSLFPPPIFEVPSDANGDNIYDVVVQASDGTLTDTQAISITVNDDPNADPNDFDYLGLPGPQSLTGSANSNDLFYGGAGNDTIDGQAGGDTIYGGSGDDVITAQGSDPDLIFGGSGNDRIEAGQGGDTLIGGLGNDTLQGGQGNDALEGSAGNDNILGGQGADRLIGGIGADTMEGGQGADRFEYAALGDATAVAGNQTVAAAGVTVDSILDFQSGEDSLVFNSAEFSPAPLVFIDDAYDGTNSGVASGAVFVRDGNGLLSYDPDVATEGYTAIAQMGDTGLESPDLTFTPPST
ncbi:Ig-like domain-containing protein [Desertibaculum subflavum]|uniref:Ig-like domain-containing protein n=1 Tax=Desertibaculum subflavum TaxID=2268458 RepID=UPI000E664C9B